MGDDKRVKDGWRRVTLAQGVLLAELLLFVLGAWAVERELGLGGSPLAPVPAIAVALVPAAVWLAYFYLHDLHEPEPTHYVLGVFLLGALVAAPAARWLIDDIFGVGDWVSLRRWSAAQVAGCFLVIAAAQELAKYLVVRYTVYLSDEMDEPLDGIVYMTAAGIGFATAWNVHGATTGGGVTLSIGAIDMTVVTVAHACFSGALGYAMGRARFASPGLARTLTMPLGYLVAVALNGGFSLLEDMVTRRGLDYRPWTGLVAAGGFAVAILGLITYLMRRQAAASPHRVTQ